MYASLKTIAFLFSVAIAALLSLANAVYIHPDEPTLSDPTDLVIELEDQPVTERQWRAIEVDSVLEIGGHDIQLQRPLQVVPSDRGVAVVDFGDRSVKQFDWSGTHVQTYGRAGRGPGEFVNPTDADIAEGTIWIADGSARRLTRIDDDSAETIPVETGALRVAPLDRTSAFVMTATPAGEGLFSLVQNGEVTHRFGQIVANQPQNAIALDGEIRSYGDHLFYSSYLGGFVLSYDRNGTLRFAVRTLNSQPLPDVEVTERGGGTVRRVPDKDYVNANLSVDENGIHVFTIKGSVAESALVVDTYSREDGSYQYSVKIQKDLRKIRTLRDVHVGIENDTSVTAYWYRFTS